jgi:quinol monooxygenase YgiN
MADGFVVLAEFDVAPGQHDAFMRLVRVNAAASVRDEPGCRRFDVLTPEAPAERVVLYEIYHDRAAFDAHLRMPHFAAFDAATREMVRGRVVRRFDLDENAS